MAYDLKCEKTRPSSPRTDMYARWALATGFADARGPLAPPGDPDWVWLLLELGCPASEVCGVLKDYKHWLRVPPHYQTPLETLATTRYCTGIASKDFVAVLLDASVDRTHPVLKHIVRFEIGHPSSELSFEDTTAFAPASCSKPPKVI